MSPVDAKQDALIAKVCELERREVVVWLRERAKLRPNEAHLLEELAFEIEACSHKMPYTPRVFDT